MSVQQRRMQRASWPSLRFVVGCCLLGMEVGALHSGGEPQGAFHLMKETSSIPGREKAAATVPSQIDTQTTDTIPVDSPLSVYTSATQTTPNVIKGQSSIWLAAVAIGAISLLILACLSVGYKKDGGPFPKSLSPIGSSGVFCEVGLISNSR